VDNGGWLDEVHWVRNTEKAEDLAYLQEILDSSPRYKMVDLSQEGTGFAGYNNAWGHMERGKLYIKIDDDVIWMADDTIPRIVTMKIQHPEYFIVSANIINSPLMGWVHYHMGAMHPYFPEYKGVMDPPSPDHGGITPPPSRKSWKYTKYPSWEGQTCIGRLLRRLSMPHGAQASNHGQLLLKSIILFSRTCWKIG
jgi:hypothetical protein